MPLALSAGEVQTIFLFVQLQPAGLGPEDQARQLGRTDGVVLAVEWSYWRVSGLPIGWRVIPARYRRNRTRVTRSSEVEVDARPYRDATIAYWRQYAQYEPYADLAEGRG
jgi:hypothetical protein